MIHLCRFSFDEAKEYKRAQKIGVVSFVYTLFIPMKTKMADNQTITSHILCPEQESNLHASRHSHLKRARLPFRHLGEKKGAENETRCLRAP